MCRTMLHIICIDTGSYRTSYMPYVVTHTQPCQMTQNTWQQKQSPSTSCLTQPDIIHTVFPRIVSADTINLSNQNNADTIWGRILFGGGHYYFTHVVTPALAPSDEAQTRVDDEELTCIAFPNTRRSFATSIRGPASSILVSFSLGASLGFAYNVAPIIWVGGCGY